MKYLFKTLIPAILLLLVACENNIDKQKPSIDITITGAFPVNCDTIYFGEQVHFRTLFTDNIELGSFSIDIHNNFDHHSHSTEVSECNLNPVKEPVNPFVFIEDYDIPEGMDEYRADIVLTIPSGNTDGLFDDGDYHFFISLTDKDGWSTQKGLSIKMAHRGSR